MGNKDVKEIEISETLAASLDSTQKNAIHTEKLIQYICQLSGQELHNQVVSGIIADEDTDWEKKVELLFKVNAEYDQRQNNNFQRVIELQSVQTKNVGAATRWWTVNWIWVAVGSLLLIGVATPNGRKTISSAGKYLLTA